MRFRIPRKSNSVCIYLDSRYNSHNSRVQLVAHYRLAVGLFLCCIWPLCNVNRYKAKYNNLTVRILITKDSKASKLNCDAKFIIISIQDRPIICTRHMSEEFGVVGTTLTEIQIMISLISSSHALRINDKPLSYKCSWKSRALPWNLFFGRKSYNRRFSLTHLLASSSTPTIGAQPSR